jgi:GDPmannose 4,6-dehydratase
MFGKQKKNLSQNEKTKFHPMSIYGVSKVFAHNATILYREAYGMFACNGILFNHESPRRGPNFVTKKIAQGLVRIKLKKQKILTLGNLYAIRDWGHAKDYVEMQWLMLQQKEAKDYVIATGQQISVRDFIDIASEHLGKKIIWKGKDQDEVGYWNDKPIIRIDKRYYRPTEVDTLLGDSSLAQKELGWKPRISIKSLIQEMIDEDLIAAQKEALLNEHGFSSK